MTLVSGTRLGPYTIVSALGSGGMAEVYRARDTRLERTVAIKVLPPDLTTNPDRRERFAREARAVAALSHPHICALHDFGSDNGLDYLVMEYLEGETLAEHLIAGPLPLAKVLRYAIEIADALDEAHRRGFIHRDLKPANVMITKSGAMLLDFGVAKSRARATFLESAPLPVERAATESLTAEGTLIGTLPYMAPEQLEGREADARSDLFAFGALVYEMVTRRRAFDGQSHASVIAAILATEPPPMTALQPLAPPALDRVVRKCLAKNPDERWQSAHDLKTALQWIEEAGSRDHPGWPVPARVRRRERLAWIMAGVCLVVSAVALGIGRRTSHDPALKPISFLVSPPENTTIFSGGSVMALSPDGRQLVLVATPRGEKPLLWIRSLDATAARPLAGTTDAISPFWSPDSRFVAFTAGGKLKKIDVANGDVQTLCEAGEGALGGTWSAGGVILFRSAVNGSRIERVSASGGRPTLVATRDPSRGEFAVNWPQFLPDGHHFLYLVRSARPEFAGIFVASLDGPDRTRVLSEYSQALYVPPGYLVFHREGTVFAQRFDAATLKLSGDALPLVNDVAFNPISRRGVFSISDTGVLAYRAAEDSVLSWFDRAGTALSTIGPPGHYHDPALSPDGRTVAIARRDPRVGTDDIWLIDADRGSPTRFTFDGGLDGAPIWSPDGTRIVYVSRRPEKGDLYVKSVTGTTAAEQLLSLSTSIVPVDWSYDGRFVLFSYGGVWALPFVGERKPFAVLEAPVSWGTRLSHDGRWLAYVSNETGTLEVYVRPFPDTSTGKRQISDHGGVEPKWRHDGKELFYLAADQRLMAVSVRTASSFEADPPTPLFETHLIGPVGTATGARGFNQYDVTPDGRRFLINAPALGSSNPITVVVNWLAMGTH